MTQTPKLKRTAAEEERYTEIFGQAEQLIGTDVECIRLMALFAYDNRKDRFALKTISEAYWRNARQMAMAVIRWPGEFMSQDGSSPGAVSVDRVLSLFELARFSRQESNELYREMCRKSLRYWQVKELIEIRRLAKQPCPKLRIKRAKIDSMTLSRLSLKFDPEHHLPDEALAWLGKIVNVRLELAPGEALNGR